MCKILVVEDEKKIARLLKLELEHEGYEVDTVETGREALEKAKQEDWQLILLDVMLPELSGIEVLRRLRAVDSSTPVILLTAKKTVSDIVSGLDLGANDYITKPFQIEELLARIRASMRTRNALEDRQGEGETDEIILGDLRVNLKTRDVVRDTAKIELTPKEYDLMVYLLRHKNQVLTREQIIEAVWGYDHYGDTHVVDVYILYLRKKMDQGFDKRLIQTVRGVGYTMKEPTEL